jgi:hypothetical protein
MKKRNSSKLRLNRETLQNLGLEMVVGAFTLTAASDCSFHCGDTAACTQGCSQGIGCQGTNNCTTILT